MSMGAKRRSAEQWRSLVDAWRRSGQPRERFARERGLKASTLGWWASELTRRERLDSSGIAGSTGVEATSFLPVRVIAAASPASASSVARSVRVEIVLGAGRKLRVPVGADAAWVARMVSVLEVEEAGSC